MLAAFLNNNLPYERTIMNSKMTLTAVLVASLFAAPAFAKPTVNTSVITDGNGYLGASDEDFKLGLDKIKYPMKGVVTLTAYGNNKDESLNGLVDLNLNNSYELISVVFNNNSGLTSPEHKNKLTLDGAKLNLTQGITFQNASMMNVTNPETLPSPDKLKSENKVLLQNGTLIGNVTNFYASWTDGDSDKFVNGLTSATDVTLTKGSQWIGDLVDQVDERVYTNSSVIEKDKVKSEFLVELAEGSTWTGGVNIAENSTADVKLDMTSSWTVNKDSKVNSVIQLGQATKSAESTNGLILQKDVTLTIANGTKESSIANLKSEAGSALAVENAKVTISNASGNTNVVLNEKANVTVDAAADKVNATFNTLDGTKFTTADNVKADVEVSGKLVDAKGMNAVIEEFNKNQSYEGKGTVLFSGGLMANDVIGHMGDKGFVQTGSKTNANLVSIGESTAVTMMQWRADADDMAQRMGELRNNDGAVGLWARTYGGKAEADHVFNKYNGIQVGSDTQIGAEGVKHFVGGAFSYTKGDADFVNGSGDNYMASLTGYSTWIYEGGSYLDVSAKWGKLTNDFDIGLADTKLAGKFNTHGVAMSVETGHRFPVGSLAYVEPQLAFTASHISGESYKATQGIKIEQDSIDSYVARVGVQAGLNCPDNVGSLFVRASYLYDFDGETSTTGRSAVNQSTFDQDFGGGWYELGVGMNVNFTKNFHGYADFEYVTGGEIKTPYRWNAGVRYTF